MKLHTFPAAPNPRRVHVYLAEKGLEIPTVAVDILKRENRTREYRERVDPMGRVPVLELDDGSHLAESLAICRYLEALHPEPPLFGRTPEAQGRVEMWIRRVELDFMVPLGLAWVHGSPLTKGVLKERIPAVAEQAREQVRRYYDFLDRELAERAFLAGDEFTMADVVGFTTLEFAERLNGLPPDEGQAHLRRWAKAIARRPSTAQGRPPALDRA